MQAPQPLGRRIVSSALGVAIRTHCPTRKMCMTTQNFVADARKIVAKHLKTYGCDAECDTDGHLRIELFREELTLRIQALPDLSNTNATPIIYLDLAIVGRDMDEAGNNIVACVEPENLNEDGIVKAVDYLMIVASDIYEPDDGDESCLFSKPYGTDSSPVLYSEFSDSSKVWFRASAGCWSCFHCHLQPEHTHFYCVTIDDAIAHIEAHRDAGHKFDHVRVLAELKLELEEELTDD